MGGSWSSRPRAGLSARVNSALVKAIARAHRWQRMLESAECGSITELAAAEKIDRSYLCRMLRLTLLAPEVVEAILDGRQSEGMTLPALMKGFAVEWEAQRALAGQLSYLNRQTSASPTTPDDAGRAPSHVHVGQPESR